MFSALLVVIAAACSAAQQAGDVPRRTTSRDVLLAEEIRSTDVDNLLDAIRRLRPRFLTPGQGGANPVVYINGRRATINDLRSLRPDEVAEVRYLESGEATTRYGTGHLGGAIEVKIS
jgi:hypothetical protein